MEPRSTSANRPVNGKEHSAAPNTEATDNSSRSAAPTSGTNTASASRLASAVMTEPNANEASARKLDLAHIPQVLMNRWLDRKGLVGFLCLRDIKALADASPTMVSHTYISQLHRLHRLVNKAESLAAQCRYPKDAHELLTAVARIKIDLVEDEQAGITLVRAASNVPDGPYAVVGAVLESVDQLATTAKMQLSIKDYDNAKVTLAKAEEILDATGSDDPPLQRLSDNPEMGVKCVNARCTLAALHFARGDEENAVGSLKQAWAELELLSREFVAQAQEAISPSMIHGHHSAMVAFARIGAIAKRFDLPELSGQMYAKANHMNEQYPAPGGRNSVSLDIAGAQVDEGDNVAAKATLDRWAVVLSPGHGALNLYHKAQVQVRMGDSEGARFTLGAVEAVLSEDTSGLRRAPSPKELAYSQLKVGDVEGARGNVAKVMQNVEAENEPNSLIETARLCLKANQPDDVQRLLEWALDSVDPDEAFEDRADIAIDVARVHLEAGDTDRTNRVLQRVKDELRQIEAGRADSETDATDVDTDDESSIDSAEIAEAVDTVLSDMIKLRVDVVDHQVQIGQLGGARQTQELAQQESAMIDDVGTCAESLLSLAKIQAILGEFDVAAESIANIDVPGLTVAHSLIDMVRFASRGMPFRTSCLGSL